MDSLQTLTVELSESSLGWLPCRGVPAEGGETAPAAAPVAGATAGSARDSGAACGPNGCTVSK